METGLQEYLDSAVSVLNRFGIQLREDEETQLANILQGAVQIDEPKVLAIARTLKHAGVFNQLVRDNVQGMNVAQRYDQITELFDSIRDDSKKLVTQLEDGRIDYKERAQNLWMRVSRGSTHSRFEKIKSLYESVSTDSREQLENEDAILDAYINFRFALKESEILAYELLNTQEERLKTAENGLKESVKALDSYQDSDNAVRSRLQMTRDEASEKFENENKVYQLVKDVAEDLKNGYNVGEVLIAKLKQTHDVKERVYQRSVSFFTTNEHVFTTLDAVYTSQHGLHEATQTLESMKSGVNRGLEDIADLGKNLERAALKAGYGSTYNPESVQKLVDAIVSYQIESRQMISQLRDESTKNAEDIRIIVDDGKKRTAEASYKFLQPLSAA